MAYLFPYFAEQCCPPCGPVPFGAPPTCGQKYSNLVQANGYGPDNPTGYKPWASVEDVDNWRATAQTIHTMARTRWNALIDAENARQDWTASRAIRDYVTAYEKSFAALPEAGWYEIAGAGDKVKLAVANALEGACALELLDDALAKTPGASTMPVPYNPDPFSPLAGGLGLGVLVAGGLLLFMLAKGNK